MHTIINRYLNKHKANVDIPDVIRVDVLKPHTKVRTPRRRQ